jgi:sugar phosphate isomerase/epimerase
MELSLFSISYAGFWGQDRLDLLDFIGKAAALGYDSVTIAGKRPHLSPLDATPERLGEVKARLDSEGITCGCIAGYTDFSGAAAAEVPILEMQISYVESLSRIAAALGAGVVRVFSAYESPMAPVATVWGRAVESLRECSDRAADLGVTIAIQNHHDIGVHSDSLLELLNDIDRPNCKLGFDAWSPALRGEEIHEAAKKMAPYAAITTNADYVRLPRFQYQPDLVNYVQAAPDMVRAVPFGDGFIDYSGFFAGLREGGFDGIATYEMCSPVRGGGAMTNLDKYASRYLSWMKEQAS